MFHKTKYIQLKEPYHATEIQLDGDKSQLLYVFNSGKRDARSDICWISKQTNHHIRSENRKKISNNRTNLISQWFPDEGRIMLKIFKDKNPWRTWNFSFVTRWTIGRLKSWWQFFHALWCRHWMIMLIPWIKTIIKIVAAITTSFSRWLITFLTRHSAKISQPNIKNEKILHQIQRYKYLKIQNQLKMYCVLYSSTL